MTKILFKGTLRGSVSYLYPTSYIKFVLKLDEKIEGIPEELPVFIRPSISLGWKYARVILRPNDKILLHGQIIQDKVKFFKKEEIYVQAKHIYNETLKCGC